MKIPELHQIIKKIYPRYGLRDSDILIASYPKSGNTWMRFIWANLVSLIELGGRDIDFQYLNTELVAEYDSHSYGSVEFDCLPRLVKTHGCYDTRAYGQNRSIYLVRHPGDVAISYFEFRRGRKGARDPSKNGLRAFLRDEDYGVPAWCDHVRSWRANADMLVKYEELKANAVNAVESILQQFELATIENSIIERAVKRSSFNRMKTIENERGGAVPDYFDSEYRFMRSGSMGEWRERFDEKDIKYMRHRIHEADLGDLYSI